MNFYTKIFDNSRLLTKYINDEDIKKENIVSLLINNEHKYVLFYYK
jgi:hypothetical protein